MVDGLCGDVYDYLCIVFIQLIADKQPTVRRYAMYLGRRHVEVDGVLGVRE